MMKKLVLHSCGLILAMSLSSCEKEVPEPVVTNQKGSRTTPPVGGNEMGTLVVFAASNDGCTFSTEGIEINIDGEYAGKLVEFFGAKVPGCDDAGTITKTLAPGAHTVSGKCSSAFWPEKEIIVHVNQCARMGLY